MYAVDGKEAQAAFIFKSNFFLRITSKIYLRITWVFYHQFHVNNCFDCNRQFCLKIQNAYVIAAFLRARRKCIGTKIETLCFLKFGKRSRSNEKWLSFQLFRYIEWNVNRFSFVFFYLFLYWRIWFIAIWVKNFYSFKLNTPNGKCSTVLNASVVHLKIFHFINIDSRFISKNTFARSVQVVQQLSN